jgi:Holliday junction resolvase
MPNRNKQRGYELERETVLLWEDAGADVRRVFGSGAFKAAGEDLEGDIKLGPYTVEAKRKKSGYKFLYDALDQDAADLLVVRQDRSRRLYLLEEKTLLDLMRRAGLLSET